MRDPDPAPAVRCEGRYPVPQTSPPRDEPFQVTYRCALPQGHDGPHGDALMSPAMRDPDPAPGPPVAYMESKFWERRASEAEAQILVLTAEHDTLKAEVIQLRRIIDRFQEGTLLGAHGRQQADKIHELDAALRTALADQEALFVQQRDLQTALREAETALRTALSERDALKGDVQHLLDTCVPVEELREAEAQLAALAPALRTLRDEDALIGAAEAYLPKAVAQRGGRKLEFSDVLLVKAAFYAGADYARGLLALGPEAPAP